jgi:hypothetical protein
VEFETSSYRSGLMGLVLAVALVAVAIALGSLLVSVDNISLHRPLPLLVLGLGAVLLFTLVVLALVLHWSVAALRLRYRLDRNGLVIQWGASRLLVPMERIQSVVPGHELAFSGSEGSEWPTFRGIAWAGLRAGRARFSDDTPTRVLTTSPLAQSTVVFTPERAYVVSPRDPDAFIEAWRVRRRLGPTQHWQERELRATAFNLPIWRDRLAWMLVGLGLLANLAQHIYLSFVYERLPTMLSFHFNVLGQADRIANRIQILRLPQIALLMLLMDLGLGFALYRGSRVAAYLIWGGGLAVQLFAWGAIFTIIG